VIGTIIQSIKLYLHRKEKFYGLSFAELGFIPRNRGLYNLALLHKSASKYTKSGTVLNYERLEFLGDAILGAIIAEILYKFFPKQDEGELTRLRSKIVSRESLNEIATQMGLDKEVIARSDISKNKHIYGDVFEAFTGAIYLDQGYLKTKQFIEMHVLPRYVDLQEVVYVDKNYKSRLIEWGQKNKVELSINTVESRAGRRSKFTTTISIDEKVMGKGIGSSKKEAEQHSAENAIRKIQEKGHGRVEI
jgi:ribonuclease-3